MLASPHPAARPQTQFRIRPVRSAADLEVTVRLFNASASALEVDLGYQGFATELANLPGNCAPPAGELLLACDSYGESHWAA